MKKLDFKKKVLQKARERQDEIINDFKMRIADLRVNEMIVNEGRYDDDERSISEANKELISGLAQELNFALEEKDLLKKMVVGDHTVDKVVIGAIVVTDQRIFYPSVSLENFEVDGKQLFGISLEAPLYKEMEGKKKGDSFQYGSDTYQIIEIY